MKQKIYICRSPESVRRKMKSLKVTQDRLAKMLNMSTTSLRRMINGEKIVSEQRAKNAASILGLSIEDAFRPAAASEISYHHMKEELSREDIDDIVEYHNKGFAYTEIARAYDCDWRQIREILQDELPDDPRVKVRKLTLFNEDEKDQISNDYLNGATQMELTKKYACSPTTIRRVLEGKLGKNPEKAKKRESVRRRIEARVGQEKMNSLPVETQRLQTEHSKYHQDE